MEVAKVTCNNCPFRKGSDVYLEEDIEMLKNIRDLNYSNSCHMTRQTRVSKWCVGAKLLKTVLAKVELKFS